MGLLGVLYEAPGGKKVMRTLLIYFKTSMAENMSSAVFYVSEVDIKTVQQTFQVCCGKFCSFTDVHIFFY